MRPWKIHTGVPTGADARESGAHAAPNVGAEVPLPRVECGDMLGISDAEPVVLGRVLGPVLLLAAVAAKAAQRQLRGGGGGLGELQATRRGG